MSAQSPLPKVVVTGRRERPWNDLYHWLLQASWSRYFFGVVALFVGINFVFAGLYYLQPGCIQGMPDRSFEHAFYFSIQTFGTIGYGVMSPATRYAHVLVTCEVVVGMSSVALITGLTFAKFSRPTARVLFTNKIIVRPRNGIPTMCFRMANSRHNTIAEANLRIVLLMREVTQEGEVIRVPVELKLVRDRSATFILSWTAFHIIDESSPFFGENAMDQLRAKEGEFFLSFTGTDETLGQTIHARTRFALDDVVWNAKFGDLITVDEQGNRLLDYAHLHTVVPLDGA